MKRFVYLLIMAVLVVTLFACNKPDLLDDKSGEEIGSVKTMNDLVVDNDFDWKTTKDLEVVLTTQLNGVVKINSKEGFTYHKAMVLAGKEYTSKITIPSYVKSLELEFGGETHDFVLNDNKIEFNF